MLEDYRCEYKAALRGIKAELGMVKWFRLHRIGDMESLLWAAFMAQPAALCSYQM